MNKYLKIKQSDNNLFAIYQQKIDTPNNMWITDTQFDNYTIQQNSKRLIISINKTAFSKYRNRK